MKKFISAALVAAMSLSLVACGGSANTASTGSNGTSSAPADKVYNVGVVQLVQHEALDAATQGFQDALKEKLGDQVNITVQNASGDSATCATIANGYVSENVDLIMANATPALQAAMAATDSIPILGTSVTDYGTALSIDDWTGVSGKNVSGTCDLAPLADQAAMVNELFPEAKKVGIIYCSAEPNSKYQSTVITPFLEKFGYEVTEYTFADSNDIAQVTSTACEASDVIYIPTDNTAASCTEAIQNVALPAGTPIITGEGGMCAGCGVATLSISYYDLGYATGIQAYEILANGKNVAEYPVEFAKDLTKKYNKANCEALGVTVPADYSEL